jgi:hypothetical protein
MSQSNAAMASDNHYRVWINITFTPSLDQLADHLWDGLTMRQTAEWSPEYKISMNDVRLAVARSLQRSGTLWFVEDDDDYDNGGRAWAIAQVKRTYKFPEV